MMIKINSNTLVSALAAIAIAYMASAAMNVQDFLVMLFIAFAVPTLLMSVVLLSNKWAERKRNANYYVGSDDAWKKNTNKGTVH
jgi:hypothetical protein